MIAQIGKYTVEEELGFGGFGRVYKAWDPDVRQSVAIKVLLAEGDPDLLKRFQLEVVTTASLHHKNIVTIHASGEERGTPYLVMELLEGRTLSQIVKQRIPLSLMDKVRIMTQVAEGLAYAHSKGVVHRDIKPANIMLLPDGSAKIMDFGIALASNQRTLNMTMGGFVLGTIPYMAPEQFTSDGKANEQTDIFSFGDVYYELLAGKHPFEQYLGDLSSLHLGILNHDPQPLSQVAPECPEALELLVHRTLSKEREFRYQTFEEVRFDSASVLVDLQHEQAARILREVAPLLAIADLREARAKVREAQKLEPGNRQARQLLETIDQELHEKATSHRIAARLTEAEKHLSERRFAEAVQTLETAAKLDTGNVAVQMLLADAKSKSSGAAEANRLLADARATQQRGALAEALQKLDRAIEIDPEHTEVRRQHARVSENLSRYQRNQVRQQALRAASDYMAGKRFGEALSILDQLEAVQPGESETADLRRDIESLKAAEERRLLAERLQRALATTRETIQKGELERGRQMLEHLSTNFSTEPGVAEALPLLQERLDSLLRAREISTCRRRVDDLLKEKSFEEASGLLADALRQYPDDAGLVLQKTTADSLHEAFLRSEAVAEVLNRTNRLRDAGDLDGALSAIAEGRTRLRDESALVDLGRQIEIELEQQRHAAGLESLIQNVHAWMAADKYAEAVDEITRAREYSGEAEVRALLDSVRGAAAAQEEQRFVAGALAAAANLRIQQDWKQAVSTMEQARLRYPRNSALSESLDRLRAEIERNERCVAIERHRAAILSEIEAGAWNQAQAAVRGARKEFPDEGAIQELDQQVEAGAREYTLQVAAARIRAELAANHLPEAMRQLDETRSAFARDLRWKAIEEEVALRRAYEAAIEEAEQHRREGSPAMAEALLAGVISGAPDARAAQLLEMLRRQRVAAEAAAKRIAECLKRLDLRQAIADLNTARSEFPDESLWAQVQAEIDEREAFVRRQTEIAALAESVRSRLKQDDSRRAARELASARSKYPDETLWATLQAEIDSQTALRKQRAAAAAESVRVSPDPPKPVLAPADKPSIIGLPAVAEQIPATSAPFRKRLVPWKLVGGGAAVMFATGLLVPRLLHKSSPPAPISRIPVEIRSDPPGATVRLGDRSCETPNCQLELPPGRYEVEAQLRNYVPTKQTVVVDASPALVDLTLVPLPPPAADSGQPKAATGTLLVQAGVADALVYIDGTARSRTDHSGSLTLSLEAKAHEVRVERNGYETPAPRKVTISEGSQQSVVFTPTLLAAKLELRGAPAGVEVRAGRKLLGVTDGSAAFVFPSSVTPGDQPLQVTVASTSRSIHQRFEPGQTLRLEWKDVTPGTPAPAVQTAPTAPTPEMLERSLWDRVRNTSDIEQFRAFLRSYPSGPHAREAETHISDIQWSALDQTSIEAVRTFLKDNPESSHRSEAQRIVDQLEERIRSAEQAKQDLARKQESARQEASAKQDQQRRHDVFEAVKQLATAVQGKRARDIKAIWPKATTLFLESVGMSGVKMSLNAKEEDVRFPQEPDQAVVQGSLVRNVNGTINTQKAILTLRKSGGDWKVENARFE